MLKAGLCLMLCLTAGTAWADWSPEIVLYQNPIEENIGPSGLISCIAGDMEENVHIVYRYLFWRETEPIYLCQGLVYLLFDDHGNQLAGPILLTDSTDESASLPKIRFFEADSFLVMYWGGRINVEPVEYGFRVQTMHVDGNPIGDWRMFSDTLYWSGFNYAFDITDDDRIVFAFPDTAGAIRVVVELPSGERFMDHTVVWQQWLCDELDGFVDQTDSLQLVWRQRTGGDANYAKRVAINVPFDPIHLEDHIALTPLGHALPILRPLGDSLLTFLDAGAEQTFCDYRLRLLYRDTYAEHAQVLLGPCPGYVADGFTDLEPNGQLSLFAGGNFGEDADLHFKRFSIPELVLLEDTAVIVRTSPERHVSLRGYTVSPAGARHVLYVRSIAPSVEQLCYRYWRSDLSVEPRPQALGSLPFQLSPNPSYGYLQLHGPLQKVVQLSIWNILGQRVAGLPIPSPVNGALSLQIPRSLPSGIYFLRVETVQKIVLQKFVLIH